MLPLALVPTSHTEDEGSMGNLEFELESCQWPVHPDHINKRLLWPELHLSNPPSHKQLFALWGSTVEVSPLKGQWWLLVDLTAQTYPEVQQAPSSLQTILPPYLFAECCLRKIKDQELLWAALLSVSPENLIPHARPLWPILSRVDLSFKGKRSGHLASMYNSCLT